MKMKIRTIFINIVVFLSLLIGLTICLEVYLKFFGKNIQITSGDHLFSYILLIVIMTDILIVRVLEIFMVLEQYQKQRPTL